MSEVYEKISDKEVYIISLKRAYLEVIENHDGVAIYRKIDIKKEDREKTKEIEERTK